MCVDASKFPPAHILQNFLSTIFIVSLNSIKFTKTKEILRYELKLFTQAIESMDLQTPKTKDTDEMLKHFY